MLRARHSVAIAALAITTAVAAAAHAQAPSEPPVETPPPPAAEPSSFPAPSVAATSAVDPFASRGPSVPAATPPADIVPHYPEFGPPRPVVPLQRYSSNMMTAGIVMTTVGVVATITGALITASSKGAIDVYCDGPAICMTRDDTAKRTVGSVVMFTGAGVGAIGFPLWLFGGRFVPIEARPPRAGMPDVRIGAGRASASFAF